MCRNDIIICMLLSSIVWYRLRRSICNSVVIIEKYRNKQSIRKVRRLHHHRNRMRIGILVYPIPYTIPIYVKDIGDIMDMYYLLYIIFEST